MCRIDGGDFEPVTVLRDNMLRGRADYRCEECRRTIPKGEEHQCQRVICEGSHMTFRTCVHCLVAQTWLIDNCGGYVTAQVVEEIKEHADEYPQLREPLTELAKRARAKWAMPWFGGLMPLSAEPPSIESATKD